MLIRNAPCSLAPRRQDFPNAEIVWCQEEPKNMGAWAYVRPRIETALRASKCHSNQRARYTASLPPCLFSPFSFFLLSSIPVDLFPIAPIEKFSLSLSLSLSVCLSLSLYLSIYLSISCNILTVPPLTRYVGRAPSAATATGDKRQHVREQTELVDSAIALQRQVHV